MNLPQPDKVTIIKSNGNIISEVPAFVQTNKIFINDGTLPLEENDIIERKIARGLIERYRVLDKGYFSYPNPHYQVKISKESALSPQKTKSTTIIHQHGDNSRVNIQSTDVSNNEVTNMDLSKFEEIKQVLNEQIFDDEDRKKCLKSLDELTESVGDISYGEKYKKFIDTTSKFISIIGPFIPYLTSYL